MTTIVWNVVYVPTNGFWTILYLSKFSDVQNLVFRPDIAVSFFRIWFKLRLKKKRSHKSLVPVFEFMHFENQQEAFKVVNLDHIFIYITGN